MLKKKVAQLQNSSCSLAFSTGLKYIKSSLQLVIRLGLWQRLTNLRNMFQLLWDSRKFVENLLQRRSPNRFTALVSTLLGNREPVHSWR